jgi:hypothetical protein
VESVDLEKAIAVVGELARASDRRQAVGLLERMGFRVPAEEAAGGGGALLVVASRYGGTVTLYELPADVAPELGSALSALSGQSFSRLEDLAADQRGPAARLLAATRQTGLGPDELADWLTTAQSSEPVSEDELAGLDGAWADLMRAELTARGPAVATPPLAPFARVYAFVYDGN